MNRQRFVRETKMRFKTWQPVLLASFGALFGCLHQDATSPLQPSSAAVVDRVEAPPLVGAVEAEEPPADPVDLVFAWPETFVANVTEQITTRRRIMEEVRIRETQWQYALRSAPTDDGFRLYATELTRVHGERLPFSVVEMNALQPALVIGADGDLRRVQRVDERGALWSDLTGDGIDREVSAELRAAALQEEQFVALDPMRWTSLVALWNHITLRQGEVLLIEGWIDSEPSRAMQELLGLENEEGSEEADGSGTAGLEPRASIQLVGLSSCPETTEVRCVELRMLNVVEDRRAVPSSVYRVEINLITEPDSLRPHRLVERTSQVTQFESIGAVNSTTVERQLLFRYDHDDGREHIASPSAL